MLSLSLEIFKMQKQKVCVLSMLSNEINESSDK